MHTSLMSGLVIPAHPLALTATRKLDERRQRALTRYYLAAGAGGVAVGVHTTQFSIRDPKHGLFRPVLELAASVLRGTAAIKIAGVCGETEQAAAEARIAKDLGYDIALLSLGAMPDASIEALLAHAKVIAEILPLMGFYLQPAVGGRTLPQEFWRRFAQLDNVVAIKVAPFNRYQTLDVMRGVAESGRARDIALYTGNDDNIVADLLTPFQVGDVTLRFTGGLLGQWAVWTRRAVELLRQIHAIRDTIPGSILTLGQQLTDVNAAIFDAANGFHGCIPGIHDILRAQGLLAGLWCLDPQEDLSPGQAQAIERVRAMYPHLNDDAFVAENLDAWLR